jgi:hypothetical protein
MFDPPVLLQFNPVKVAVVPEEFLKLTPEIKSPAVQFREFVAPQICDCSLNELPKTVSNNRPIRIVLSIVNIRLQFKIFTANIHSILRKVLKSFMYMLNVSYH